MENKEQTAVEWLIKQVKSKEYQEMFIWHKEELFEKAKQMEKEQIINSFVQCWIVNVPEGIECKMSGKEYYEEYYGNGNN